MTEIKKGICPYDCPSSCGLLFEVEDGRIRRVKNDPDHPVSRNGICRKTIRYEQSINSDRRILYPLKRSGAKGSGCFTRISWTEAVSEIADRWKRIIRESGPEAIWYWMYSGVMSDIQRKCGEAFFNRLGSSRLVSALCCPAKSAGYTAVAGGTGCLDPRELKDSDLYLIWGSNLSATRLQTLTDLKKPKNRHKKKILIETYPGPTAQHCDECYYIKAGTDGALALAMMQHLEKRGLSDTAFLKEYTEGYEEFRALLQQYTPEWAEKITGIPATSIRYLAETFASVHAPAIILGSGLSRYGNGGMTVRLITILSLFTGAWKYPGGGLCGCTPVDSPYVNMNLITRPDFRTGKARGLNINQAASALSEKQEKPVRSLYVYAGNPVNTVFHQTKLVENLKREDLFTVVHERFLTETAEYADIILPAAFSPEQDDIYRCYGHCTLGTACKAVDPPGECKSNWDTFCLLAEAMGFSETYFQRTERQMLEYVLAHPTDAVLALPEEKRQVLKNGGAVSMPFSAHLDVRTPSGKFRIVNHEMEDPVPYYKEAYGGSEPLKLVAAPSVWSLNSEYRDNDALMEKRGEMSLILSEADAKKRGIRDGQTVKVWNDLAEVQFRASVRPEVPQGNVICEGVYRMDRTPGGRSVNALMHERLSDLADGPTMNDNTVEVEAASET